MECDAIEVWMRFYLLVIGTHPSTGLFVLGGVLWVWLVAAELWVREMEAEYAADARKSEWLDRWKNH